jgi:hypothetical protein
LTWRIEPIGLLDVVVDRDRRDGIGARVGGNKSGIRIAAVFALGILALSIADRAELHHSRITPARRAVGDMLAIHRIDAPVFVMTHRWTSRATGGWEPMTANWIGFPTRIKNRSRQDGFQNE